MKSTTIIKPPEQSMPSVPDCYGIIPARYGSTRFPGKPLADILGKPMFWHVYQRASQCPQLKAVWLATDDARIAKAADELAVPTVMTAPHHPSGTDRVLEAAQLLGIPATAVVVNIQGDEPLLAPQMLSELLEPFADPAVQVTTLACEITAAEADHPDRVKVVFAPDGRALYFSRAAIPFHRDGAKRCHHGHIGLYGFRMDALARFVALGQSRLESIEKLEQLRLLENHMPLAVVITRHRSRGVDSPEDLQTVRQLLANQDLSGTEISP
jgi:3-deoxy-manno-octulosonate cytidylyltransferase (CMP-KDO synthetase)